MTVPNIFSKATGTVVTKFHIEPAWAEGIKLCSESPGHMTNMADMSVHGKTPLKSLEPVDQLPSICSTGYLSNTKIVQMMTLVDLDPFYGKVTHGRILEHNISWKVLEVLCSKML